MSLESARSSREPERSTNFSGNEWSVPTVSGSRRSMLRAAAWSLPAVAVATSAPAAAASGDINVGDFRVVGSCGSLGTLGPGFTLSSASTASLPSGTVITIIGSGVANIGVFSTTGGLASVTALGGTARLITLTAPLAAGAVLAARTTLSISVAFTMTADVSLPTGYAPGAEAKARGSVSATLMLCSSI